MEGVKSTLKYLIETAKASGLTGNPMHIVLEDLLRRVQAHDTISSYLHHNPIASMWMEFLMREVDHESNRPSQLECIRVCLERRLGRCLVTEVELDEMMTRDQTTIAWFIANSSIDPVEDRVLVQVYFLASFR